MSKKIERTNEELEELYVDQDTFEAVDDTEEAEADVVPDEEDEDYFLDDDEDEDGYLDDEDDDEEPEEVSDEDEDPEEVESDEFDNEEDEEYDESGDDDEEDGEDDESDEEDEEYDDEVEEEPKKHSMKKLWIVLGSIVGGLAVIYLGISVFFMSHFYINTEINGISFSGKSVADVENYMKEQVQDYQLTILEKDNKTDVIDGDDISLVYEENDDVENALNAQNAFLWPMGFFSKNAAEVSIAVSYDEAALAQHIEQLQSVTAEQTEPISAIPTFDGTQFVITPEVLGTAVNKEVLTEKLNAALSGFESELDMEAEECYKMPPYTSESPEVQAACDAMNNYCKASITYTMGEDVVVDKALISGWLSVNENMEVTFHEDAVRTWLTEFGDKYDTEGAYRSFTTPTGRAAEVSGGTYGWSIDEDAEYEALVNSIKNGEVVTKEPAYYQTAASHSLPDWGSTYAEVDLSYQHMWYVVDGSVAMESDVVTGLPDGEKDTPTGVYSILEVTPNKTLVGNIVPATGKPEYETPVSFWMRVTWSGIGFHDATWQPGFGGSLYQSIGSHGCINMPYDAANTLFNMISVGTPVIIHW